MTSFSGSRAGLLIALCVLFQLGACGGGDGVVGTGLDPDAPPSNGVMRITGAAEKGPFVKGSEVLVRHLATDGVPSTASILSEIKDNLGTFVFSVAAPGPVLITADGYHFNEVTGALSPGRLLLRAVHNVADSAEQTAYVNVLTHLTYKRVLVLMAQGMSTDTALRQAESDVLQALRPVLPVTDIAGFTQFSIYDLDTQRAAGNAYVLALSATMVQTAMTRNETQQSSVDAELTAILNALADDISDDGTIADAVVLTELAASTRRVRPDLIRTNLETRSLSAGPEKRLVANMDLFIDTDGDGVVNAQDEDDDNDGIADEVDVSPYVLTAAPVLLTTYPLFTLLPNEPFYLEWATPELMPQLEIQVATNSTFSEILFSDFSTTPGWYQPINPGDQELHSRLYSLTLDTGVYYARARAQNELGGWGVWSVVAEWPVGVFAKLFDVSNGMGRSYLTDTIQLSDGGFFTVGSIGLPESTQSSPMLVGLYKDGNLSSRMASLGDENIRKRFLSPFELPDGSILVGLEEYDANNNSFSTRIIKFGVGSELWRSAVLGPNTPESRVSALRYVTDNNRIVVGATFYPAPSAGAEAVTPLVVKLDAQGRTLWSFEFDQAQTSFHSMTGMWKVNGGYAIAGERTPDDDVNTPAVHFVAKLSTNGAEVLSVTDTTTPYTGKEAVPVGSSGDYVLLSHEQGHAEIDLITKTGELRYNVPLNTTCQCEFSNPKLFANADTITFGGELRMLDGLTLDNPDAPSMMITQLNAADGVLLKRRVYKLDPSTPPYQYVSFIPTADQGYAMLARLTTENGFIVVKTDPLGNAPTVASPVRIPY